MPVGEGLRRVAAIDLGTNSTHLLIASVDPQLRTFQVLLAEKSTTRLGERDSDTGDLSAEAMERARLALRHCRELASSHDVEEIVCVATSAMREAPNGLAFLQEVERDFGLKTEVISGPEEARLIYLGVLSGMDFAEHPHYILDIGGGSTELILADAGDARALTSSRVGAVRLQRDFIRHEPLEPKRVEFLRAFIQGCLEPAVEKVRRRLEPDETPVLVATSGTAMAAAALLAVDHPELKGRLHGAEFSRDELDALVQRVLPLTPDERRALPGINARRAEIIVPGLLVLQQAMEMLGAKRFVISDRALREGLIIDWMLRHDLIVDRFVYQGEIRRRTVMHHAHKYGVSISRAERIAAFALELWDQTRGCLHRAPESSRQLLWAAAMVHRCGLRINTSAYHKHSWYLVQNGELLGYSHSEQRVIASLARYHRKSLPKKRHESWSPLSHQEKALVERLSLLLRLAVAMDRRPGGAVKRVVASCTAKQLKLQLEPIDVGDDLSLELWSLQTCAPFIESAAGLSLHSELLGSQKPLAV
ncbi:MAG: Ppx/GppA phosphatase family protein [Cyanobacteriota bacterium]|nr:Ppx/GppA phosphatase family protein [Cyanobacteriota bacterium]